MTRPLQVLLALSFCFAASGLQPAYSRTQTLASKPLTNGDIVDMLNAGLSQEIIIAKIKTSASEFDTSPGTLATLKVAKVPDSIILAMVQVPISGGSRPASSASTLQETAMLETSTSGKVNCSQTDPVPVFPGEPRVGLVESFTVKCGDKITILGAIDKQSWLKIRAEDGQVGYISRPIISVQPPTELERNTARNERLRGQKAADEFDDCKVRAQNEYDAKMKIVSTTTLTPLQRVYASSKLKQNLDARLKSCRSEYESR